MKRTKINLAGKGKTIFVAEDGKPENSGLDPDYPTTYEEALSRCSGTSEDTIIVLCGSNEGR